MVIFVTVFVYKSNNWSSNVKFTSKLQQVTISDKVIFSVTLCNSSAKLIIDFEHIKLTIQ